MEVATTKMVMAPFSSKVELNLVLDFQPFAFIQLNRSEWLGANDTLMNVRAPVGDLNVAHTDCCIGRGLAAIHSKNNHQSFVLYTMFSLKKQLDVFNGEGTVFGSINRNSLNEMPIHLYHQVKSLMNLRR